MVRIITKHEISLFLLETSLVQLTVLLTIQDPFLVNVRRERLEVGLGVTTTTIKILHSQC